MAQSDALNGRTIGSKSGHTIPGSVPALVNALPEQGLARDAAVEFVLGAPEGSVRALGGIDGESLRALLDQVEPGQCGRRVLLARVAPAPTAEAIVEHVIDLLADTARRLWPIWFTDVSFGGCRNDTLGRLAAGVIAAKAARDVAGLSQFWVKAAALLALDDRPPRVKGAPAAIELTQLALAIGRSGFLFAADVGAAALTDSNPAALVHALEWIARHSHGAVVALFPELPPNEPPFDRILYGAQRVTAEPTIIGPDATETGDTLPWIAPWCGLPHSLSAVERQLAEALHADAELAPLFGFNQFVGTARGSRPKVDLVWKEGRLIVELDGYGSHGNRAAFMYDRHRDYELALSGYTVLRIANDEILQDIEKAIDKIRDLVKLCRARAKLEE